MVLLSPFNVNVRTLTFPAICIHYVGYVLPGRRGFLFCKIYVCTLLGSVLRLNQQKVLLKTYASYSVTGIVINNILSWLWIDILGESKLIAPIINPLISVPLNFIFNKFWAFKEE